MPGFSPIQPAFHGGETSPRSSGRVDTEIFKYGLEECRNWEPTPQGSLRLRPGTRHVSPIATSVGARLVAFKVSGGGQDFILELGSETLRVYDEDGRVQTDGVDVVTNGLFPTGLTGWTYNGAGVGVRWSSSYGGSVWVGWFVDEFFVDTAGRMYQDVPTGAADTFTFRASQKQPGGSVRWEVRSQDETVLYASGIVYDSVAQQIDLPDATVRVIFIANGNPALGDGGYLDDVSLRPTGADVAAVTPWTLDQLRDVQFVNDVAANKMYFAHPNAPPQELIYTDPGAWTFQAMDFGVSKPAEWTGTNYPGVIEIWAGRLWLAATPAQPNQVWYSKSGDGASGADYYNFATGTNPDSPSNFKLQTKGKILWLQGQSMLLIGTDLGEYAGTASDGVIKPGDVRFIPISAFGSAQVQAIAAGDEVLYVTGDRRTLRAVRFTDVRREDGAWDLTELTFHAEHITASLVQEIHHARNPHGTIALLLGDGSFACCTRKRQEKVAAWYHTEPVSGTVFSAAVSDGPLGSRLWVAVERDGQGYLEMLNFYETLAFSDAAVVTTVGSDGTVTGLGHLEGKAVVAVVDDIPYDAVVAGGQVVLDAELAGQTVAVGLAFEATATTLPLEGGNPAGTSQGLAVHYSDIFVRVYDSDAPLLNGERAGYAAKPFEASAPLKRTTGDLSAGGSEVSSGGKITIRQDRPVRTEVCAIFGRASVGVA